MTVEVRGSQRNAPLQEVCTRISSGGTPSRKRSEYFENGNHLWVKSQELRDGSIYTTEERITDEALATSSAKLYPKNTLLIAMYGATVGKLGLLRQQASVNQAICALVVDEQVADYKFVFYSLVHNREDLISKAFGAAQQNLNQGLIRNFKISLPPLGTQHKIASVLSAYDDLIENNTRRIEILEEMAQRIYREWFVHFRFPGHEKVGMVESDLGPIPKGWEVKKSSDVLLINPKTKVPKEGEKPFVPMGSLSNNSMLIGDIEFRAGNSGSKFKNGDTLFARITPSLENGKTGYVQFLPSDNDVAFGSTEFIVLRSKTLCPEFVYLLARSNEFRDNAIKSMTGASGRQRVQEESFDKFLLVHPDVETLYKFSKVVSPLFQNVYVLAKKNANLRRTRNLLLPKLISGEVEVGKLDILRAEG